MSEPSLNVRYEPLTYVNNFLWQIDRRNKYNFVVIPWRAKYLPAISFYRPHKTKLVNWPVRKQRFKQP